MPSNGQGDYNVQPPTVRSTHAPDDLLEEIIKKPPPTLEVKHDFENILTNLVSRMIILTDISETQEMLAAYYQWRIQGVAKEASATANFFDYSKN